MKVLLVTFSDNADHQDITFGMFESLYKAKRSDCEAWVGMIRLTKVTSEWRIIKEYQRRKADKGSGRAIIALARKITRIVFVMLSKRERFNLDLMRCEDSIQQTA